MAFPITIASLITGWFCDFLLGDPEKIPHPVVGMGKAIHFCERKLNKGSFKLLKGAISAIVLIITTYFSCFFILNALSFQPVLLYFVESIIIFYCLAGTTLIKEVKNAFIKSEISVEEGRRQVSRIVGRDTSNLTQQDIKTACLETLSENLSDGVVAPLFWLAILGVPGMLTYKMVNTLDSMIGYRTARFKDFGCFAARIDDIANYVPSRLTSCLMIIFSGKIGKIRQVMKLGSRHLSPNSGYPEAALAVFLNCQFGGPHDYFGERIDKPYIGENYRELSLIDLEKSIKLTRTVELVMIVITAGFIFLKFYLFNHS